MVELEIDGKKIKTEEGASIIEAADKAGIYIPRFCYHHKLSIAANCRMCLVEVEKSGKPLPACATPVTAEMKVFTQSDKAIEAQRAVMEYLLINHPLDCPICDQGGACELQDLAMGFGSAYSYYDEGKRAVFNDNLGPLIATEMTRCIHCTRCVRFGEEIAGMRELGVTFRGEREFISTYIKHFIKSEVSGNIIDLCPVGALTAKPSRYTVRGWEVRERATISPHDCVGANIYAHVFFQEYAPQRKVYRVVPRQNEAVNEIWISDRDRFSYEGLYHQDRIYQPKIKQAGYWQETDWKSALVTIVEKLKTIAEYHGAEQIGGLISANATTEECYLFQKMIRGLGSNHVDHRIREHDFSDQHLFPVYPKLGMSINEIEELDTILLVGSNIQREQPLLNLRINQAQQNDAKIFVVNPIDLDFVFSLKDKIIQFDLITAVAEIVKAAADLRKESITELTAVKPSKAAIKIANALQTGDKAAILVGAYASQHHQAAAIRSLLKKLKQLTGAQLAILTDGGNAAGAWLAGAVPHRQAAGEDASQVGLDAKAMLTSDPRQAYLLFNLEPEFDSAYPAAALQALNKAELVICFSTYVTPAMEQYADLILPIAPFTETTGTFINIAGDWQSFTATSEPMDASKPGWKVLRLLANLLRLKDFNYESSQEIIEKLKSQVAKMAPVPILQAKIPSIKTAIETDKLTRLAPWPLYRSDAIVRRSEPLQKMLSENIASIQINQTLADHFNFSEGALVRAMQGDAQITLPLIINNQLADQIVMIPSGLEKTAGFGEAMATVTLEGESQ